MCTLAAPCSPAKGLTGSGVWRAESTRGQRGCWDTQPQSPSSAASQGLPLIALRSHLLIHTLFVSLSLMVSLPQTISLPLTLSLSPVSPSVSVSLALESLVSPSLSLTPSLCGTPTSHTTFSPSLSCFCPNLFLGLTEFSSLTLHPLFSLSHPRCLSSLTISFSFSPWPSTTAVSSSPGFPFSLSLFLARPVSLSSLWVLPSLCQPPTRLSPLPIPADPAPLGLPTAA